MGKLTGKSAIVLGAAGRGNMGQVIAARFAEEGAQVLVAGRHEDELNRFSTEINGAYAICDITKRRDIDAMIAQTQEQFGKLDIAVNATGWGLMSPFEMVSEDDLDKMIALQFKGPFMFMQAAAPAMRDHGGSIIQISSATATIMLENHAPYMGTKAGIDHVVRCVANEFGKFGVRANSISPGLTSTPMTAEAMAAPGLEDAFAKEYPLGRIGTSDDIAAAATFLASDECFMTGQNLQVNGGLTLRRNPTADEIQASIVKATS
jgi:NAD(P)-dependent dehydrogenase (short-subunit alcohol dehydrogenase family)